MGLKVIGSGFGRTGTNSLKLALEQLGFGPCHHMFEVAGNPGQLPFWQAAARGEIPNWDEVFADYNSSVDWPSAKFWRELADHYPEAKIVHSVRPSDKWFESVHNTIYPSMMARNERPSPARERGEMAYELIIQQTFDGRMDDRDHAIAVYEAHTREVLDTIPPERLLVYNVGEGWEPLCRFLGVPVPKTPYPHTNTTSMFQERLAR
ncbi:MAG: sulfotransferase family protein [Alphaproteobacteria bacterium]|nr:sulfotransferase family protein [Alphaproteobacteria bacterium]